MTAEKRILIAIRVLIVLLCLAALVPESTCGQGTDRDVESLLARMSPTERVGQLFLVGFPGHTAEPDSLIAELIRKYRIGGIILTGPNGNLSVETASADALRGLIAGLQGLALSLGISPAQTPVSGETTPAATPALTVSTTATPGIGDGTPSPLGGTQVALPLFIAMDNEDMEWWGSELGLPVPSTMSLGATWDPEVTQGAGAAKGRMLRAVGVNMLWGPPLDLANPSRAGLPGDLRTNTFGESPFWVGQMASSYVRGIHAGGEGAVLAVASHFPGWGAADRDVRAEVPVVQDSLESHLSTHLLPFLHAVTPNEDGSSAVADGLLISHVQFRNVTASIQMARPMSVDSQALNYFLNLPAVRTWRESGGLTVSDFLGAQSVRNYYAPQMEEFQAKRVAYDAFLAGNDVLALDWAGTLDGDWESHFVNVKGALEFFQAKYSSDSAFKSRVDASVRRILMAKQKLYPRLGVDVVVPLVELLENLPEQVGEAASVVVRESVTLIYPRNEELIGRIPSPPTVTDRLVIFEDVREIHSCATCDVTSRPLPGVTQDLLQSLYGQQGSGHLDMTRVETYTFKELWEFLRDAGAPPSTLEQAIREASWLIFVVQSSGPAEPVEASALREFLKGHPELSKEKRIAVFSCGAPYYLDSTDIAKVSALYAVYGVQRTAIEAGLRALFREIAPQGLSPVSIPGVNYSIANRLQPAPLQMLYVEPSGNAAAGAVGGVSIELGDELALSTGVVRDLNGNMVPDGTVVTFLFSYPASRISWQQEVSTLEGKAVTVLRLDVPGTLEIAVTAGQAVQSTKLIVAIADDKPAIISTVVPTAAPTSTTAPTPASPVFPGDSTLTEEKRVSAFDLPALLLVLCGLLPVCVLIWALCRRRQVERRLATEISIVAFCAGMFGYLAYGFLAGVLQRQALIAGIAQAVSWRWQSAIVSWLLAWATGLVGHRWPRLAEGMVASLRRAIGGVQSQS